MKVVFFDGSCALCSGVVRWTHRRDRQDEIWFAALESSFAAKHREKLDLPAAGVGADTFAFWDQEQDTVAIKSSGALKLLKVLGGFWAVVGAVGSIVPLFMRDGIYDLIARNRRKWFGSSESCELPPDGLKGKVLS